MKIFGRQWGRQQTLNIMERERLSFYPLIWGTPVSVTDKTRREFWFVIVPRTMHIPYIIVYRRYTYLVSSRCTTDFQSSTL